MKGIDDTGKPPDPTPGRKRRALRSGLFAALGVLSAAIFGTSCPKPTQYGGPIPLDSAGVAARFGQLCKARRGEPSEGCPPVDDAGVAPASVHRLTPGEELAGPMAMGRPGDYLVENGEVAFVVQALGRGFGFAEGGGNVIDAADARVRVDELSMLTTSLGAFPRQAVYDALEGGVELGGIGWVEARGHDSRDPSLAVVTRYTLTPRSRALAIETTVENRGAAPSDAVALGDNIAWGTTDKVADGMPRGFTGKSTTAFLGGAGASTSYVVIPFHDELVSTNGDTWSDTRTGDPARIPPGQSISYARELGVGERGGEGGVTALLGVLTAGVRPPPASKEARSTGKVAARICERRADGACPGAPGKLTIVPEGNDGDSTRFVAAATVDGDVAVDIAPGRYRMVASRGPAWSLAEGPLDVEAGRTSRVTLAIAKVVDTKGYIGCDLHQHATLSGDAAASNEMRVLSNVAEGVECAVASEHNGAGDLSDAVHRLGVDAIFRTFSGDEVSSDANAHPFGHVNIFPLVPVLGADVRAGAPSIRDLDAHQAFSVIRALPGPPIIQVNHPLAHANGYFHFYGFDPKTGAGTDPHYDGGFDAIEVWNGNSVGDRDATLAPFYALLLTGHVVTPTANSDTHSYVGRIGPSGGHEAGYPRTYIATADDTPTRFTGEDLIRGLRERRDVVLTNGPFVRLTVAGVSPGGVARAKGGHVTVNAHVERAPWVDATSIAFVVGGEERPAIKLTGAKTTALGAKVDDVSARLAVPRDTFVLAVVRGERSLGPVVTGGPLSRPPFAMTSPVWVDADGDGRSLGR